MSEFRTLCEEIERRVQAKEDASALLDRWNARANRVYEARDFTTFHGAMNAIDFVETALLPRPELVRDLRFAEARSVFENVAEGTVENEAIHSYYLWWLEAQFPDAGVSDLIFWPDQWFGVPEFDAELTADQLVSAAMQRSGRMLEDAPVIALPMAVPPKKRVLVTP